MNEYQTCKDEFVVILFATNNAAISTLLVGIQSLNEPLRILLGLSDDNV